MATVAEIENAMRNAAAAGDKQAVIKLAAARKALMSASAAQPRDFAAENTPVARPGSWEDPNANMTLAQRSAGMVQEDPDRQAAIDTRFGVPEAAKSLWAGLKQTGASIQDAYNMFVHGKPNRKEEIVTAPDGTRTRNTALLDTTAEKKAIAEEMIRAQVAEAQDIDKGATKEGRRAVATATQLAGAIAAPEVALPRATTLAGAMVRNALAGNASNALMFDAEGGGLGEAALATGAPALLGTVTGLSPAVKNYIGRALAKVAREGRTAKRVASVEAAFPKTGRTLTLAQRTGVPELITLERAATNSQMVNHFADQTDTFVNEIVDTLRQPLKPGQTLANDFVAAKTRASENLKAFKLQASDNYDTGIKEARRIASEGGGGNSLPVNEFRGAMSDVFAEVRGMRSRGSKAARDISEQFMRYNENLFRGKETMTVKELTDLLVDLSARARSKDPVTRKLAGKMRAALEDDMRKLEDTASFWADDAAKTLLETRKEYARAQALISELSENAGYKLLGVADGDVSPAQALEKFKSFDSSKRAEVRNFLEENSPDMLASLKQAAVDDFAQGARTIRAGADSQNDLDSLVKTMFDPKSGMDLRTSGLWNAEELKRIESVREGLRTIANNRPLVGPAGTPVRPEDVAINAVSQHPAFLARAIARILMASKGARFFTDPVIYDRMRVINRATSGSPTDLMARAALLDYLNTDYLEQSAEGEK